MLKLTMLARRPDAEAIEARFVDLADPEPSAVSRFDATIGMQTVEIYFEHAPSGKTIDRLLDGLPLAAPPSIEQLGDEDWVRRVEETLSPVRAGRFIVHGPHDRDKVAGEPFAIEIEAGEAFGTAHHPTTRGCLIAIDRLFGALAPERVLDLGCGSGVLAIAAAKLMRRPLVLASDIDPRSVEIAAENFSTNGVADWCEAIVARGFEHPKLAAPAQFDCVMANILAEPLITLAPDIAHALRPGAKVVLSGLLDEQADAVDAAYRAAGLVAGEPLSLDGWSTLMFATGLA